MLLSMRMEIIRHNRTNSSKLHPKFSNFLMHAKCGSNAIMSAMICKDVKSSACALLPAYTRIWGHASIVLCSYMHTDDA